MEDSRSLTGPLDPQDPPFALQPAQAALPDHAGGSPALNSEQPATLAPWYHTAGIVLLLLLYAFIAHLTHHRTVGASVSRLGQTVTDTAHALAEAAKVPLYASTMMLSWMLLASVVAGLYHRRAFFRSTLRRRLPSRWADPALASPSTPAFLPPSPCSCSCSQRCS